MNPLLEEVAKYIVLGVLGLIWKEVRGFYRHVKQNRADIERLDKSFRILANRDRKSFDFLRRILYQMNTGCQDLGDIRSLRAQVDLLRESAYRASEYRTRREAGNPHEDCGDLDLAQLWDK